ncbi:MAG: LytTR family DNA-binding domain-containing protein [Rikenellaceae bacterium]
MNCIAVDDEPLALKIISNFCNKIPFLNLVATAPDGVTAIEILKTETIDLVFIDINMPHINGIETVKLMEKPPIIIFTTAYQNYALDGFELSALDYLVKPFSFDRFLKAVNKAQKQHELIVQAGSSNVNSVDKNQDTDFLIIKVDYSLIKIKFDSIKIVEGLKDYVKICTGDKNYITKSTMKNIEEKLSGRNFMRIHKSYLINLNHIDSFENNHVIIDDKSIALGGGYRDSFLSFIDKNKL